MPKVSIIVPVYNVEKYIHRCVESLLNQTLSDIQIILVDDESPDNCSTICDEYAKMYKNIQVIHKKNGGLGFARNSGLDVATGSFVSFIDSDDYVEPDMMEKLYLECINGGYDAVYSEFNVDDYPGFKVIEKEETEYEGRAQINDLILDIIGADPSCRSSVKFQCSSCKALFSLGIIKKSNVYFKSEREFISEDLLFNIDFLCCANKVKYVPYKFYHYCLNGASLSHSFRSDRWEKLLKMLDVLDSYQSRIDRKDEFKLRISRTCLFYTSGTISQLVNREDINFGDKIDEISNVLSVERVIKSLYNYPVTKLPFIWSILAYMIKYKCKYMLYILFRIHPK